MVEIRILLGSGKFHLAEPDPTMLAWLFATILQTYPWQR